MRKILVLGGTGAMGEHLVKILAQRGNKVFVTTRSRRQSFSGVEYILGDAQDEKFIASILETEWDAIVDFMLYSTALFEVRAPLLLANTKQYIYLSSARVYADSKLPIKEDFPRLLDSSNDEKFLATDEYALAKARQEDILTVSGGNNWTIVRPYITYSEQRLQLGVLEKEAWLYRALKGRAIVFSKDIAVKLTTMTYGLDVAKAIAALIGESKALGQAYHIAQVNACTWHKVLDIYLDVLERHLGKRPRVLMLELDKFSRCKRAEYQIRYDRLFDRRFDNSKISEFLDVSVFCEVERGLAQCLSDFLREPNFQSIDWCSEGRKDRFSGDRAGFYEIEAWKDRARYFLYRFIKI